VSNAFLEVSVLNNAFRKLVAAISISIMAAVPLSIMAAYPSWLPCPYPSWLPCSYPSWLLGVYYTCMPEKWPKGPKCNRTFLVGGGIMCFSLPPHTPPSHSKHLSGIYVRDPVIIDFLDLDICVQSRIFVHREKIKIGSPCTCMIR
jgi:hypothetical protein